MYSKYEKPLISASIFYYDSEYQSECAERVCCTLEKYGVFPPEKIYADKLTNGKFIDAGNGTKDIFIGAYSEKDVLGIDMASGDSRKVEDFWRVSWGFTFYKNSKLPVKNPKFIPWNVLTFQSTYGRLNDKGVYNDYILCIKELIEIVKPFYASIDDLNNHCQLLGNTKDRHFVSDRIQEIYWGNYFGPSYFEKYKDQLTKIPGLKVESISNGVYFSLTESVFDFDSNHVKRFRKVIKKDLNIDNNLRTINKHMWK